MQEHNIVIPGISLCQKWGKIRIFHSTIVALGEPKYIRFLFNPEKRGLVVQACARKDAECFRVPKYNPENWEFKISSVPIRQVRLTWSRFWGVFFVCPIRASIRKAHSICPMC